MATGLKQFWTRLLHAGDVSGKVMTLIALPSAIFAVAIFFNEIGDTLTSPDVKADIHSVGLRCGTAIDQIPENVSDVGAFAVAKCMEAPLSAWVKLDIENEDAIDRTLASVAFEVGFPESFGISPDPLLWTETREVNHVIQNDQQTSQRWPWRATLLAPGQRMPMELDFRPFEQENQIKFERFRDLIMMDPSPLSNSKIPVRVLGRFSGTEGWRMLGKCEIDIPKASVERKRTADVIRALTRRCI